MGDESPLQDGLVHPSPRKGIGPPYVDKSIMSVQAAPLKLDDTTKLGWLNGQLSCLAEDVKDVFEENEYPIDDIEGGMERYWEPTLEWPGVPSVTYLEYGLNDHYGWHKDFSATADGSPRTRVLSHIIQLSDVNECSGGDLVMKIGKRETTMPSQTGLCCSILSKEVSYKITPVTYGTKKVLMAWTHSAPKEL